MKIHIEFCIKWHYDPEFERVSKIILKLNSNINIRSNEIYPRSGAFEVTMNDTLIFSKLDSGRFPNDDEINSWIKWYDFFKFSDT